jgi:hypothetical protein
VKRVVEIEDTLQERTDSAIADVKAELIRYLEENQPDSLPDLSDLDDAGAIHEIVDGWVPIYTYEIKCLWFLYQSELETAHEDSGCGGDNPMETYGMAAIYYLIDQKIREWWENEAEAVFEDWLKTKAS